MIHLICPNPAVDRTLLLNRLEPGSPNRPIEVRDFPGGKSFNVAYALELSGKGQEVTIHTILGGHNGERVRDLSERYNTSISALSVTQNTRECNILVDLSSKEIFPIYEKGFELTPALLDSFTQQLIRSISDHDLVVFSGSLMKGMPEDYIVKIQESVEAEDVKFIIDTSGEPLKAVYQNGNPHVIKINDEEYNELLQRDYHSPEAFIHSLKTEQEASAPYFIITMGGKGAVAKIKDRYFHLYLDPIEVKNPIASGDHFLGRLVQGVAEEEDFLESLKRSIAYSTSNCLYWYPHIEWTDVEKFYQQVKWIEY
ncbi:1-phosphofructokinase [Facklamia sp. DSM 111018]|uniref:Tagatose-6-phosphate kinase n=1 Tax=Facklamia lactis TaxID=2749967 RepID=A0ABS0LNT5_9LACT|nr:PfkB family carbohydrate kinase [Facklamia lactis]MBG9979554.1 1-phosphofructokinase [Facklamia lactis]MBG9985777.1 1-phosphofructokinase [Facklamia lactis]